MDLSNLLKPIEYVIYLTPGGGSVKFLFQLSVFAYQSAFGQQSLPIVIE